jgi:hypothetical protein
LKFSRQVNPNQTGEKKREHAAFLVPVDCLFEWARVVAAPFYPRLSLNKPDERPRSTGPSAIPAWIGQPVLGQLANIRTLGKLGMALHGHVAEVKSHASR